MRLFTTNLVWSHLFILTEADQRELHEPKFSDTPSRRDVKTVYLPANAKRQSHANPWYWIEYSVFDEDKYSQKVILNDKYHETSVSSLVRLLNMIEKLYNAMEDQWFEACLNMNYEDS